MASSRALFDNRLHIIALMQASAVATRHSDRIDTQGTHRTSRADHLWTTGIRGRCRVPGPERPRGPWAARMDWTHEADRRESGRPGNAPPARHAERRIRMEGPDPDESASSGLGAGRAAAEDRPFLAPSPFANCPSESAGIPSWRVPGLPEYLGLAFGAIIPSAVGLASHPRVPPRTHWGYGPPPREIRHAGIDHPHADRSDWEERSRPCSYHRSRRCWDLVPSFSA